LKIDGEEQTVQLEHLHSIIERLASNSFVIKGWAITIVSGFLGFSIKDAKPAIAFVGLIPCLLFWIMDAYYLAGERYFRNSYNDVLKDPSLGTAPLVGQMFRRAEFFHAISTPVLAVLYLTLILCCTLLGMGLFIVPNKGVAMRAPANIFVSSFSVPWDFAAKFRAEHRGRDPGKPAEFYVNLITYRSQALDNPWGLKRPTVL
jgi:hypothetical protein